MVENKCRFLELSLQSHEHLRCGNLKLYIDVVEQMAVIFLHERKYIDCLKSLMLVFYFNLSGISKRPFISKILTFIMRYCLMNSSMDEEGAVQLFCDTIRKDTLPSHKYSIEECTLLLTMCLSGKSHQAKSEMRSWNKQKKLHNSGN